MKLKKTHLIALVSTALLAIPLIAVFAADILVEIQVSPNVLNLANNGQVVTVHTDIPYSLVVGASVYLNDVPIDWWKSDDCGNFVAKFEINAIKDIVEVGPATLTLTGDTITGETFCGVDEIEVIDKSSNK